MTIPDFTAVATKRPRKAPQPTRMAPRHSGLRQSLELVISSSAAPTNDPTKAPITLPMMGTGTPRMAPVMPPRMAPHAARLLPP